MQQSLAKKSPGAELDRSIAQLDRYKSIRVTLAPTTAFWPAYAAIPIQRAPPNAARCAPVRMACFRAGRTIGAPLRGWLSQPVSRLTMVAWPAGWLLDTKGSV